MNSKLTASSMHQTLPVIANTNKPAALYLAKIADAFQPHHFTYCHWVLEAITLFVILAL